MYLLYNTAILIMGGIKIKKIDKNGKIWFFIICLIAFIVLVNICVRVLNIKVYQTPKKYTQEEKKANSKISAKYKDFMTESENYTKIPALKEGAIPQGMCYSSKYNILIVSSYFQGDAPSVLHFLDYKTGKLIKSLILKNKDNSLYKGHAGGLATDNNKLWIVDNYSVYEYSLDELIGLSDMKYAMPINNNLIEVKADFSNFYDGTLWVGEYYYDTIYPTKKNHHLKLPNGDKNYALLLGYKIDMYGNINYSIPDYVVSIPDRIQGIAFASDGKFVISQSFWSFQSSDIRIFENILENNSDGTYTIKGKKIPLWYLSDDLLTKKVKVPPMSEAIEIINNNIFILFESGSNFYKFYTHDSIDSIVKLKI